MIKGTLLKQYSLPTQYKNIPANEKWIVRQQYVEQQKGMCMYCNSNLNSEPPNSILNKKIDWNRFPDNFRKSSIHLQHCHKTGMTEGAVHMYCNAVMWQYENK